MELTGQIIFYDAKEMMCFGVTHFMLKEPEKQMLEATYLDDDEKQFIQSIAEPTVIYLETGKEMIKLDPTTMKRIARYNLEEENKGLLKEIEERKKVIDDLEQKEQVLRGRFAKAISAFEGIMENGYYESEYDDDSDYNDDDYFQEVII